MSMITIGEGYKDKKLKLVQKEASAVGQLSWAKYPVNITKTELGVIKDQTALVSVLDDSFKAPSQMAGIPAHKIICPVIHAVDAAFRKARKEYQEQLKLAEGEDLKKIREMERNHKVRSYGGFFGWIFKVLEAFGANYRSETEVAREGSAHRIRWLYEVDKGESTRIQKIKEEIQKANSAVVQDIKANAARKVQVVDMDLMRKARQLSTLYKAIFPDDKDNANVKAMDAALAALPEKMAALLNQS